MRPGPTSLARAAVGARVSVMRGSQVLAVDVPVSGVKVEATRDRVVPTQVSFIAPSSWVPTRPASPLNNFGQRVHVVALVEVDGQTHEIEVGWYQIDSWVETARGVQVTALDLMQTLEDDPMVWPSSPPRGATLRTELQRLANRLPVLLETHDRPVDSTIQWDTSRTTSILDLCESHGLDCGVKPDGYLHVWERKDGSVAVATYRARDLLVDAPRTATPRRPNRWTAVGAVGPEDNATQVTATAETSEYPYNPDAYGLVRDRIELSGATTQAAVTAAAQSAMRDAQSVTETRTLEIVTDPRLELADVIGIVTDQGEQLVGRVIAYSASLDEPSSRMRVDVEVLLW